jgi:flagellar biosynthesis protein FlhF
MRIKTYTARDMRTALRKVREEQGEDAVILSSKRLPDRVEVSVALDPEAAMLEAAAPAPATAAAAAPVAAQEMPAVNSSEFAALLARALPAVAPPAPAADARLARSCARCATCWNGSSRSWPGTT